MNRLNPNTRMQITQYHVVTDLQNDGLVGKTIDLSSLNTFQDQIHQIRSQLTLSTFSTVSASLISLGNIACLAIDAPQMYRFLMASDSDALTDSKGFSNYNYAKPVVLACSLLAVPYLGDLYLGLNTNRTISKTALFGISSGLFGGGISIAAGFCFSYLLSLSEPCQRVPHTVMDHLLFNPNTPYLDTPFTLKLGGYATEIGISMALSMIGLKMGFSGFSKSTVAGILSIGFGLIVHTFHQLMLEASPRNTDLHGLLFGQVFDFVERHESNQCLGVKMMGFGVIAGLGIGLTALTTTWIASQVPLSRDKRDPMLLRLVSHESLDLVNEEIKPRSLSTCKQLLNS